MSAILNDTFNCTRSSSVTRVEFLECSPLCTWVELHGSPYTSQFCKKESFKSSSFSLSMSESSSNDKSPFGVLLNSFNLYSLVLHLWLMTWSWHLNMQSKHLQGNFRVFCDLKCSNFFDLYMNDWPHPSSKQLTNFGAFALEPLRLLLRRLKFPFCFITFSQFLALAAI